MGEPGGLPSRGSHRVGHDSSDLAAAASGKKCKLKQGYGFKFSLIKNSGIKKRFRHICSFPQF